MTGHFEKNPDEYFIILYKKFIKNPQGICKTGKMRHKTINKSPL